MQGIESEHFKICMAKVIKRRMDQPPSPRTLSALARYVHEAIEIDSIVEETQEEEILFIIPPMKKVPKSFKEPKAVSNDVEYKESMNLTEKDSKKMMKESKNSKKTNKSTRLMKSNESQKEEKKKNKASKETQLGVQKRNKGSFHDDHFWKRLFTPITKLLNWI